MKLRNETDLDTNDLRKFVSAAVKACGIPSRDVHVFVRLHGTGQWSVNKWWEGGYPVPLEWLLIALPKGGLDDAGHVRLAHALTTGLRWMHKRSVDRSDWRHTWERKDLPTWAGGPSGPVCRTCGYVMDTLPDGDVCCTSPGCNNEPRVPPKSRPEKVRPLLRVRRAEES